MPLLPLLLMMILAGGAVFVLIAVLMGDALLRPPRMNDGKALYLYQRLSPADVGLPYLDVVFDLADESTKRQRLSIAGWWIDAAEPSERCAILLHGYADAKVGAIAWAHLWRSLGFNVLAVDLRAHGESGGRFSTAGAWERRDVSQVINQLLADRPASTRTLMLFGASMGGAIALSTAAERSDVAGVVIDSPYDHFLSAARATAKLRAMPSGAAFSLAAWIAQRRAAIRYSATDPIEQLPRVPCPVLWFRGDRDGLITAAQVHRITGAFEQRANPRDRSTVIADADHLNAYQHSQAAYGAALSAFVASLDADKILHPNA